MAVVHGNMGIYTGDMHRQTGDAFVWPEVMVQQQNKYMFSRFVSLKHKMSSFCLRAYAVAVSKKTVL